MRRTLREEAGMVVAELAIAMPALVLVTWACLTGAVLAGVQLQLEDTARILAREVSTGVGVDVAARSLPDAAANRIDIDAKEIEPRLVRVTVARTVVGSGLLPDIRLRATAVALREPHG
jgi:hypothetical protein